MLLEDAIVGVLWFAKQFSRRLIKMLESIRLSFFACQISKVRIFMFLISQIFLQDLKNYLVVRAVGMHICVDVPADPVKSPPKGSSINYVVKFPSSPLRGHSY